MRALFGAGMTLSCLIPFSVSAANAFELFGVHLWGEKPAAERPNPEAQPYRIEIVVSTSDTAMADRIRAASRLWTDQDKDPPASQAAFLSRTRAEYQRIVGALYGEGRYGGSVEISIDGRDPSAIDPDTVLPRPVTVTITVDPGPAFTFGRAEVAGRAPVPAGDGERAPVEGAAADFRPGGPARSTAVLATERLVVEEWRAQGHPLAAVTDREATADHASSRLDAAILVESGPKASFGTIDVTGTDAMDPDFVVWMTGLKPGEAFDPARIRRAERNLRRLQVFSTTRFEEGKTLDAGGGLPMTLQVAERPRRLIGGGVTWSTLDGLGMEGYWEHRNLFGRAEKLRLEAALLAVDSFDVTAIGYSGAASIVKPGVFTPFTDLTARIEGGRFVFESYDERTARARVGLAHEFFEGLSGSVAANIELSEIEDPFATRRYLLASLPSDMTYDARDNALEPTAGFRTRLFVEPFHEFEYTNTGLIADLEGSTYWSLDADDDIVLAVRGAVGTILGPPENRIPENRLFFVGGGGSVRGYAYRNIGAERQGETVGGLSYLEASAELRVRFNESFGVVGFVDAGNAYASRTPDFGAGLKVGVGGGIRYYTGLGPLRADIAVPLDRGEGDPSVAFYLGLGQAF